MTEKEDPIRFVAAPATGARLARDLFVVNSTRPRSLLPIVVIVVLAVLLSLLWHSFLLGFGFAVLIVLVATWTTYLRLSRMCGRFYPTGSAHVARLDSDVLVLTHPSSETRTQLDVFSRIWVRQHSVVLRRRDLKMLQVLPIELFPPGAIDRLPAEAVR